VFSTVLNLFWSNVHIVLVSSSSPVIFSPNEVIFVPKTNPYKKFHFKFGHSPVK